MKINLISQLSIFLYLYTKYNTEILFVEKYLLYLKIDLRVTYLFSHYFRISTITLIGGRII